MERYRYSRLQHADSIRLVVLYPGRYEDDISFELTNTRIQKNRSYEALSYEWGSSPERQDVKCNGRMLPVTLNLAAALKRLRRPDESRTLWVDAICINQDDIEERNAQVLLMRDVYSRASSVIAWLGEGGICTPDAFEMLRTMAFLWVSRHGPQLRSNNSYSDIRTKVRTSSDDTTLQFKNELLWKTVHDIIHASYFERTWVVQEILLSTHCIITCGACEVDWERFQHAYHFTLYTHVMFPGETLAKFDFIPLTYIVWLEERMRTTQPFSLSRTLEDFVGFRATDPRDKVYGLLGLQRLRGAPRALGESRDLIADYNKSLREVYQETADWIIITDGNLQILKHQLFVPTAIDDGMPSWVPDWSEKRSSTPHTLPVSHRVGLRLEASPAIVANILTVNGFLGDKISYMTDPIVESTILEETFDIILRLGDQPPMKRYDAQQQVDKGDVCRLRDTLTKLQSQRYPTGEPLDEALLRTLCSDLGAGRSWRYFGILALSHLLRRAGILPDSDFDIEVIKADQSLVDAILKYGSYRPREGDQEEDWQIAGNVCASSSEFRFFVRNLAFRRFFTTAKGYFGLGPSEMTLDDTVCILGGAENPVILRKVDQQHHRLIGLASVYGMIDEETSKERDIEIERISIR